MSYTVIYYPVAEAEYLEAYDWYEEREEGLGQRFETALGDSISHIVNMPLSYPSKKSGRRECVMKDFPFIVVFKLYPKTETILIVSVFHTSRNPRKKYRR